MDSISIREFARRDGCNDKLVRRALERGHLHADNAGRLSPAQVGSGWRKRNVEKIAERADRIADKPYVRNKVSAPADLSADDIELDASDLLVTKAEAERRKEIALAKLREMEVDRERQRVVPVDEVAALVVAEYAKVRTRLISLPAKVASRAAVMKSAAEIQALIATEVTQALEELSLDAGGRAPADASGAIRARTVPSAGTAARRPA